jgi:hypothetical protein
MIDTFGCRINTCLMLIRYDGCDTQLSLPPWYVLLEVLPALDTTGRGFVRELGMPCYSPFEWMKMATFP